MTKKTYPKLTLKTRKADSDATIFKEDIVKIVAIMCERRATGNFKGDAFFLHSSFNWTIGTDNEGELVLVATKKK